MNGYTHISKNALKAVVIRSEQLFHADIEVRVRAICEKIKLERDLGITELPIVVVNARNGQLPFEYSFENQKKDMEDFIETLRKDGLAKYDLFSLIPSASLPQADARAHFNLAPAPKI